MSELLVAALAFGASQLLLSLVLLLRSSQRSAIQVRLFSLFLLAVSGYLLTPLVSDPIALLFLRALQTFSPGIFWLFSASLFDDHFRLRPWKLGLVMVTVLLPFTGNLFSMAGVVSPRWFFYSVPQGIEFALIAMALLEVVRHWREDLVQSRRTLRLWFAGFGGTYILGMLLVREVLFPNAVWLDTWQYVPAGVALLVVNVALLQLRTDVFFVASGAEPESHLSKQKVKLNVAEPAVQEVPPQVVERLRELMAQDKAYREMGLTIGQLASQMDMPEYRLRRIINAGLGYRNFNDFLNRYRIEEARQRLSDRSQADVPVLNIALDAGYRSLSSFNKAFKESLEQTPTEFRNSHLSH